MRMRDPRAEKLVNIITKQLAKANQLLETVLGTVPPRDFYHMHGHWISRANRSLADGSVIDDVELDHMLSILKRKRDSIQNRATAIHKHILQ